MLHIHREPSSVTYIIEFPNLIHSCFSFVIKTNLPDRRLFKKQNKFDSVQIHSLKKMKKVVPIMSDVPIKNWSMFRHLKIFQFFGQIPIQVASTSPSKISIPFLISASLYSVLNCLHYILYGDKSGQFEYKGQFTSVLVMAERVIFSVTPPLIVVLALKNRFKFEVTMRKLIAIQVMLGIVNFKIFRSIIVLAVTCGFVISTNLVYKAVNCSSWDESCWMDLIDQVLFFMLEIIAIAHLCLFSYFAQIISSCLDKMSRTIFDGETDPKRYIRTYNDLVEIAGNMNEFFDVILSIALIGGLMVIIVSSTSILFSQGVADPLAKAMNYLWILIIVMTLLHTLHVCHVATDQAERSNSALTTYLINRKGPSNQSDNLLVLIHLGAKKTLIYKAINSLVIDYNLGLSMLAAYFTYIIVLFQLDHSDPKPSAGSNNPNSSATHY